jgi:hypothetical protein
MCSSFLRRSAGGASKVPTCLGDVQRADVLKVSQQVLFEALMIAKVVIEGPLGHPKPRCQVVDGQAVCALLNKHLNRFVIPSSFVFRAIGLFYIPYRTVCFECSIL